MKTKYANSKMTLTAISLVAFTSLAGWISMHGPFGASGNAAPTAQTHVQTQTQTSADRSVPTPDGSSGNTRRSSTISVPNYSARRPVSRSRGS